MNYYGKISSYKQRYYLERIASLNQKLPRMGAYNYQIETIFLENYCPVTSISLYQKKKWIKTCRISVQNDANIIRKTKDDFVIGIDGQWTNAKNKILNDAKSIILQS